MGLFIPFLSLVLCFDAIHTEAVDGRAESPVLGKVGGCGGPDIRQPRLSDLQCVGAEYERQHQDMLEAGDRFYLVHALTDVTRERANKHASDYKLTMPIIVDSDHELVKAMNATVTPEAVVLVFDEQGKWSKVYQGRINDLYASLGNRREHATRFWLRDAVESASNGDSVEVAYRPPLG